MLDREAGTDLVPAISMIGRSLSLSLILLSSSICVATPKSFRVLMFDTASIDSVTDYTIGQELADLRLGAREGFKAALLKYPKCPISLEVAVETESSASFQKRLIKLKEGSLKGPKTALVGFSRSSNSKTVAHLLHGTSIIGISAGAAANLSEINPRFFSVASPLRKQWEKIKEIFKQQECSEVLGTFPSLTGFSAQLKDYFLTDKQGVLIEGVSNLPKTGGNQCLFFGSNFSESFPELVRVLQSDRIAKVIGTGDWAFAGKEIDALLSKTKSKTVILAPSGWPPGGFKEFKKAQKLRAMSEGEPTPILAYAYDATVLAVHSLCADVAVEKVWRTADTESTLIRRYTGIHFSNLESAFYTHKFSKASP